jgi:hypothetical protein
MAVTVALMQKIEPLPEESFDIPKHKRRSIEDAHSIFKDLKEMDTIIERNEDRA